LAKRWKDLFGATFDVLPFPTFPLEKSPAGKSFAPPMTQNDLLSPRSWAGIGKCSGAFLRESLASSRFGWVLLPAAALSARGADLPAPLAGAAVDGCTQGAAS
jgi:hypothetical protein